MSYLTLNQIRNILICINFIKIIILINLNINIYLRNFHFKNRDLFIEEGTKF